MATLELESSPVYYSSVVPSDRLNKSAFPRPKLSLLSIVLTATLLLALAAVTLYSGKDSSTIAIPNPSNRVLIEREEKAGVSTKSSDENQLGASSASGPFPWTNQMKSWQRTGFHFQPQKNWMNDPNGPMYYNGWYHFFYQYNPEAAVWGNIAWGHAVSKDLINWIHLPVAMFPDRWYDKDGVFSGSATVLPVAMFPDRWYDKDGVFSGSATVLPDEKVIMLYTGLVNGTVQVQNVAVPSNLSDPLLLNWTKFDDINPVMVSPPGIGLMDFRDPSTAWYEPSDATWRITIGSRDASNNGIALVYSTKDFRSYTLLPGTLHSVEHVGMWECIDLYPIATAAAGANHGLDPSESPSPVVKHLLKASVADKHADYYSIGTYNPSENTWVPDDVALDVGLGLRYDYGNFYASKTFYDKVKQRRVLWGWVAETDDRSVDIDKGWASLQGIPRSVLFDVKTGTHLLTWPVEEVETLRSTLVNFNSTTIVPGSTLELNVSGAGRLDIEAEFEIDKAALEAAVESDVAYDCSSSSGAADRGMLGPFGLLVLANQDLTEQTATYFYVSKGKHGIFLTHFCQDELRSSKASEVSKKVVGHTVPVLHGEMLSLRILVDHSIVESFAQGGRASITSRVYPTEAIDESARVYLFNGATNATVTVQSLKIWHMISAVNTNLIGSHNP